MMVCSAGWRTELAIWSWKRRSLRDIRKAGQEFLAGAGQAVQSVIEREMEQLKRKLQQEGWKSS